MSPRSHFHLQPEHGETSRRGKHKSATEQPEGERDESEDEDRSNIRSQVPTKKTKVVKQKHVLIGGPSDPFLNKPNSRVNLICIPISTGVVIKSDTVSLMGTDWKVNDLYFSKKIFLEVEKRVDAFFKSTVPINFIKKELFSPVDFHPAMPFYEQHSLMYWEYSNLRHILMHSFNGASRVKDSRIDVAPCTPATLHELGIRDGTVTYIVKDEGALSIARDTILGDEWDKVAEGTAVVMSLKFKENRKSSTLLGI